MFSVDFMGSRWFYQLPRPHCAAMLAGMASKDDQERFNGLWGYIHHVLMPESLDLLVARAMDEGDQFDVDHMAGLIEEVQQQHSSRPFHVDVSLSATAVQSWPSVRGRLVMSGVADPLQQLPNLYALLDAVEAMVLEGMQKEEDRERYFSRVYAPPAGTRQRGKVPKGWSDADEMALFDDW